MSVLVSVIYCLIMIHDLPICEDYYEFMKFTDNIYRLIDSEASDPKIDVRYLLWTRKNPADEDYYLLNVDDRNNLQESPLNASNPIYIMYHGFADDGYTYWILKSKTDILSLEEANIISVDWKRMARFPFYISAVKNVYKVANLTATYLEWIIKNTFASNTNIHLVGHSLGAHAAGMTGTYSKDIIINRVTGLDPAGPLFRRSDSSRRISKQSAQFVDIIHTNSGYLFEGAIALYDSLGHIDFYPNGGTHQPGCAKSIISDFLDLFNGCSHLRSTEYFTESILGDTVNGTGIVFKAWPCWNWNSFRNKLCMDCCNGCQTMGFPVGLSLTGDYFLRTRSSPPYAKGNVQTKSHVLRHH